jgi:hypothetical protein
MRLARNSPPSTAGRPPTPGEKKQHRGQSLILRAGRYLAFVGQPGKKALYFRHAHRAWIPTAVGLDEAPHQAAYACSARGL